jgi:uncharacterized protein (TIGR00730 family)
MKRLCVYCGSNFGKSEVYREVARHVGTHLGKNGIGLVYGGGKVGLMGEVADAALSSGAEVIGVIPRSLADRELAHHGVTELFVVDSMHERKQKMANLSDGFIALPGGIGTMDELFEIFTWAQIGIHVKPFGVLDVNDYYAHLVRFLEKIVEEGFMRREHLEALHFEHDVAILISKMSTFTPRAVNKWEEKERTKP